MNKEDLVTIIIPAYNHEKYIDRCIDSIINQTYKNIELIIINDGSKDKTSEIIKNRIKECKKRFKRFIFIDQEHKGQIKTFNKGCFKASGKYLSICSSDDAYTDNAIEVLCDFLLKNPEYVLAVGDNYIMDSEGKRCYWDKKKNNVYCKTDAAYLTFADFLKRIKKDIEFNSPNFGTYQSFLKGNYIPNGYLFDREIFINYIKGYSEKALLEDYYLHLQLSKYGKYKFLNKALFYYRWHSSNTSKNNKEMQEMTMKTICLEKDYAYKNGLKKEFDFIVNPINRYGIPFIIEFIIDKNYYQKKLILKIFGVSINLN